MKGRGVFYMTFFNVGNRGIFQNYNCVQGLGLACKNSNTNIRHCGFHLGKKVGMYLPILMDLKRESPLPVVYCG